MRVSLSIFDKTPPGRRRRIVLLSDRDANEQRDRIMPVAKRARDAQVAIDAIAFGPEAPTKRLEEIVAVTRSGKMLPVHSLRELTDALIAFDDSRSNKYARHQAETTVYCIDCSALMDTEMAHEGGRKRIEVV